MRFLFVALFMVLTPQTAGAYDLDLNRFPPAVNQPIGDEGEQGADGAGNQIKLPEKADAAYWQDKSGDPVTYESICDKPQSTAHADLCQQWRVAQATAKQVEVSEWQLTATTVEVGALALTIIFTGWAAYTASKAARAAQSSVEVASKAAEAQLRPYVMLDDIDFVDVERPNYVGPDLRMFVRWKNAGTTPAKDVRWDVNHRTFEGQFPDEFDFPPSERGERRATLGPGQTTRDVSELISYGDAVIAKDGRYHLYAWGWIEYFDAFPNTPRRRTEFCVWIDVADEDGKRICRVHTDTNHNGADEDCLKKALTTA